MFKTLRNAWQIPDLRKKLLYTLLIVIVFRIGSAIPVPFLDSYGPAASMISAGSNLLGYHGYADRRRLLPTRPCSPCPSPPISPPPSSSSC